MTDKIVLSSDGGFYRVAAPELLVVLLHRYNATPVTMQQIAEVVRDEYPQSDIFAPCLPVTVSSFSSPDELARSIAGDISSLPSIGAYSGIIFIGHSLGAVLARKVWALAHGATPEATVDPERRPLPWAGKVERILLLAAVSRGWTVSSALKPLDRLLWTIGTAWGNFCRHVLGKEPLIFGFRRGAPFLTTTRLQCLAIKEAGVRLPITVQLIGTDDDFIAPTDNLDLATGENFYYMEVTGASHAAIADLPTDGDDHSARSRFRLALTANETKLKESSASADDVFDGYDAIDDFDETLLPTIRDEVKRVVFVIHGIRDRGFWTRRIARKVKSVAGRGVCRSVTSTYGFFPMGPFLLPWVRRSKVEWLLDQYVTARSLYPDASFSYIGHSNGTYLLAKALEICPAIRFEDGAIFCGSMVRRDFEWSKYIPRQIGRMLNYVATNDWVVAIFPYGLERMRLQDVGGAGHLGFLDPDSANIRFASGEHSAALAPDKWEEMAQFILNGKDPEHRVHGVSPNPANLARGEWSRLIWGLLVVGVLGIGAAMLALLWWRAGWRGPVITLGFCLYVYIVKVVLTRA
ncbi:alpha/beta hydrolase [Bradyrhizobium commune]|uniref:Alpha/beta hydrolase n=1 Tax=Bradyrhizobium commune TaxID=83627 RepID=A0A7S9H155_9BRAD|nr:alpha/beta hydrolase [Bradyrhizobium commune]QPF93314.1 alpha/beta hydrolase [Bradyrhizobium commune]